MRDYNHRLKQDLEALEADLSSLTREQKAIVWTALVRGGVSSSPNGRSVWECALTMTGFSAGENGLARSVETAMGKLPPENVDKEWDLFLAFLLRGKNADDPDLGGRLQPPGPDRLSQDCPAAGWRPPA